MSLRLGKQPAAPKPTDFKMAKYAPTLSLPPLRYGNGLLYAKDGSGWGMLANDRLGDCVPAETAHGTMLVNKIAGHEVVFDDASVVTFYSEVAGYDPNDPNTDQGTDMHTAMGYRRSTGIADVNGTRHKIDAYVGIDAKDWNRLHEAIWEFGMVALGFEFPQSAMDQFNNGQPWDVDPNADNTIVGGHDVLAVGSPNRNKEVSVITWGQRQLLTRAFYEAHNDETWVPLSLEVLRGGMGLHKLDVAKLEADIAAL